MLSHVALKYFVNRKFERLQVSDGLSFGGYVISTLIQWPCVCFSEYLEVMLCSCKCLEIHSLVIQKTEAQELRCR